MTYTGYSEGTEGYLGLATSWTPGDVTDPNAVVAPTSFLMAESIGLDSTPGMVEHNIYGNARDSDRGYRTGKYKAGGSVGLALYPTNGLELLIASLGKNVFNAAIVADTIATITTALGVTTITLTSGAGAWVVPSIAKIGTGAAQEERPVLSWNAGTKTLVVAACAKTHIAGDAVAANGQLVISPYTASDGYGNLLRKLSLEENLGGKYSFAYPGSQVGKWSLKASASKFEVMADIVCNAQRIKQSSPTAFNDNETDWSDLSFEFTDGFSVFNADPTSSGTSTLQLVGDSEDWEIDLDNKMIEKSPYDGTDVYKYFPGQRQVDIKFKMMNQASRPVMWTDFLTKNLDTPYGTFGTLNTGSSTVPIWQSFFFYAPHCRVTKATEINALNDVIGETIEMRARKASGLEKLYIVVEAPALTAAI